MALAAFGDPQSVDPAVAETVDKILEAPFLQPKRLYKDSPLFNAGVQSEATKSAAALITDRIFEKFADVAVKRLPRDIPLVISGGCGLNCDWNHRWKELGHFSSVFVPPCTDDSGSALGTAIDARFNVTGEPSPIEWNVYSGLEFEHDTEPDPAVWQRRSWITRSWPPRSSRAASWPGYRGAGRSGRARSGTARCWPSPSRRTPSTG